VVDENDGEIQGESLIAVAFAEPPNEEPPI